MITGYDYHGYPIYASDSEEAWCIISHDLDIYDHSKILIDLHYQDAADWWLHGYEYMDCAEGRQHMTALETDIFQPKPARDIRAEKTRDYRKKRPKAPRYSSHIVPSLSVLACLLGVQS